MAKLIFNKMLCKSCGLCVSVCPKQIISISKSEINSKGYFVSELIDTEKCIGCAFCAMMCPDSVIEVEK